MSGAPLKASGSEWKLSVSVCVDLWLYSTAGFKIAHRDAGVVLDALTEPVYSALHTT